MDYFSTGPMPLYAVMIDCLADTENDKNPSKGQAKPTSEAMMMFEDASVQVQQMSR